MEKKWTDLSPEEKREERFKRWLSPPDAKFASPEYEKAYKARVTRIIKAIKLEEPDRVPVHLPASLFPAYYAGVTLHKVMYDYEELRRAWKKFLHEFDMDMYLGPSLVFPGRVLEALDYKLYKWPGYGLPPDTTTYQYVEGEYMKADEYDAFIRDPSDFLMRTYLPRIAGLLEPFQKFSRLTPMVGIPLGFITPYSTPDVQAALQTLMDVSRETAEWMAVVADVDREALSLGFPSLFGGGAFAPFDAVGDMLRGTQGIFIDMYRQPEKLMEAMEKIIPITIDEAIAAANASGVPIAGMALHKGTGGFMSNKQYETFYWAPMKKVMMGMINEGLVPMPFAEGNYQPRLEIISDLPKGSAVWWFEQMDMARAKEVLGDTACIAGNVPASVLLTGTPQEVKEYCRKLIEVVGKGGGFILTGGSDIMSKGNPDNLRAMMEAAKEYGTYK
jgi:uroporphyrinogen-III decarboxylase